MLLNFLGKRKDPLRSALAYNHGGEAAAPSSTAYNPFLKVGDKIRIHSRSGRFIVHEIREQGFVVTEYHKRFSKDKEIICTWDDFRNWSKA